MDRIRNPKQRWLLILFILFILLILSKLGINALPDG